MNVLISCLYAFLSRVRSDILRLAKKDALLHALVHLNVSKHISVCHKSFSYSGVRYILEAKKHQKNIRKQNLSFYQRGTLPFGEKKNPLKYLGGYLTCWVVVV